MPNVLVPLAPGVEELEAVTIIDLLRRAGIEVTTVSLEPGPVTASRGVRLLADAEWEEIAGREFDLLALPGGLGGAQRLRDDDRVQALIRKMSAQQKIIAAICAAPIALARAGALEGRRATGYPGFLDKLALPNTTLANDAVVMDANIITSRGPGTAMDFALTLIETLVGKERRNSVEAGLARTNPTLI